MPRKLKESAFPGVKVSGAVPDHACSDLRVRDVRYVYAQCAFNVCANLARLFQKLDATKGLNFEIGSTVSIVREERTYICSARRARVHAY